MGKKGRKELNPADAYRKEQRKREIKKNKKDRKRVRELGSYIKDPNLMKTEIEKMERMQGSGTLDHKLVGKLQQLQQLYPSIVKLHQRKQAMVNRGASVDEDTLEQMLDDIEAEGHAAAASAERGGGYRNDAPDQYRGAGPVPGRPPPPPPPHAQVHPMLPSPIPLGGAVPPPPPGPPPGFARGPPSLPPPVGMVMGPNGPMPMPRPLPPPGGMPMPMPIPPPRPPGPPPGYTGPAPPPPPGAPSAPSPTPGAQQPQPGLLPTPPPQAQVQAQGPPPRGAPAQQHRRQAVADPLDPGAVNYGEYRKFSYVEHQRPGAPPPRPPPMMGPQMGPGPMAGPPRGPPPGPSMGPAAGPPQGPAAGPDLGPVLGPSKPKPVDKDLVAFMPASLRVKRPTAAPSASGPGAGGAGMMRPRSVASSKVVAAPKAAAAGGGGAVAGAAVKPKQAVGDSYDQFMQELSGLL